MNMVRSMLKSKRLPSYLWGEAVSTAGNILSRSPTKRPNGMTPEEVWTGSRSDVTHFQIFGSICFRHVLDRLRKKLDDKGGQMVLLGYHSTGGYRLFNPKNKQIVISWARDDVVDEFKSWDWNKDIGERSTRMLVYLNNAEDEILTTAATEVRRSQRARQVPARLHDYMVVPDTAVSSKVNWCTLLCLLRLNLSTLRKQCKAQGGLRL